MSIVPHLHPAYIYYDFICPPNPFKNLLLLSFIMYLLIASYVLYIVINAKVWKTGEKKQDCTTYGSLEVERQIVNYQTVERACYRASLVAQMVKNPPAVRETWVQSLAWEDPLQKGMAIHASIFACRIPWREESGRLQSMESQRAGHDWATFTFTL